MIFKNFFVVSGVGLSKTSKLNAFDNALLDAGISQCNLVPVSSILPKKARQIRPIVIEPGSITFTVLARRDGNPGESISTGLGWAFCVDNDGKDTYGIVVEDEGLEGEDGIRLEIKLRLTEMVENRKMRIKEQDMKVSQIQIPEGNYGSVIVALIYC